MSFSVLEEGASALLLAVGLESGHVYLFRGDLGKDRVEKMNLAVDPKAENCPFSPVTGLGFRQEGNLVFLFAVTLRSVNLFPLDKPVPAKQVLDEHGAEPGCIVMSHSQVCIWT